MEQEPRTVWEALAPLYEGMKAFLAHPDFEVAIRNPIFLVLTAVLVGVSLWRRWNRFLVIYLGALALWGVFHFTILKGISGGIAYFIVAIVFIAMAGLSFVVFRR